MTIGGRAVLVYHGITAEPSPSTRKFWVSKAQFQEQILELLRLGCRSALLDSVVGGAVPTEPDATVVLTFDDGNVSDYECAFPLLSEAGYKAEVFVNTRSIGTAGRLSWGQIYEMYRGGMSFQSHAHEHVDLTLLSTTQVREQLRRSKVTIEDHLGSEVAFLATPYGTLNRTIVQEALASGYRAVCSSLAWPVKRPSATFCRIGVTRSTSMSEFRAMANGNPMLYGKQLGRQILLYLPKYLLLHCWPAGMQLWRSRNE